MSKLNRLNARRKIINGKARESYTPLTQEQEEAFEKLKKEWDKSQKEAILRGYELPDKWENPKK